MSGHTVAASPLPPGTAPDGTKVRILQRVRDLGNADADGRLARVIQMAQVIFDVENATVNLVEGDWQWCLGIEGLGTATSIRRADTICSTTVERSYDSSEPLALFIDDASALSEFAELPSVKRDGGVRFYAGHPLYSSERVAIGTFCLFDSRRRTLSATQREAFIALARWVQGEFDHHEGLLRSATVQRRLFPAALAELPGYTTSSLCVAALEVGGDFYDFYPVRDGAVISLADVMGKGWGAALLAASVRSSLRTASWAMRELASDEDLATIVNLVANQLVEDLCRTDSFATVFHARLDASSGLLTYVDAGHGLGAILRRDGAIESLPSCGLPLGVFPDDSWFSRTVTIAPGETFVVASDGIIELFGDGTNLAEVAKFVASHLTPDSLCDAVGDIARAQVLSDDVTVFALRRDHEARA